MTPYYEQDGISIYHGDCREVLPQITADVCITDPPCGIAAKLGMGGGYKGDGGMWKDVSIEGDLDTSSRDEIVKFCVNHDVSFAVFGSPRLSPPIETRTTLVWDKGEHTGAGDLNLPWKPNCELIFIGGYGWHSDRRSSCVIRVNAIAGCVGANNSGYRHHPFEKPVALMKHLCERARHGLIIDPFMGSGTTLRAAKDLGRRAIGIEIEERYCEIAARRLSQGVLPFERRTEALRTL